MTQETQTQETQEQGTEMQAGMSVENLTSELLAMLAARRPQFLEFVRKRVRSGADAEDLIQQALVRAAEKVSSLRASERLDAWFYRVLRNTIADHHAEWARREARLDLLARDASEAAPEDAATCACSLGLLAKVKPEYATMLQRIDIDEEAMADVARDLGLTTNNAKVRLHRARTALREELLRLCGTTSARECQDCECDA